MSKSLPLHLNESLMSRSKVYDEFAAKLTEAVSKFKVGNGLDQGV